LIRLLKKNLIALLVFYWLINSINKKMNEINLKLKKDKLKTNRSNKRKM